MSAKVVRVVWMVDEERLVGMAVKVGSHTEREAHKGVEREPAEQNERIV
jgi:hypothetical protein